MACKFDAQGRVRNRLNQGDLRARIGCQQAGKNSLFGRGATGSRLRAGNEARALWHFAAEGVAEDIDDLGDEGGRDFFVARAGNEDLPIHHWAEKQRDSDIHRKIRVEVAALDGRAQDFGDKRSVAAENFRSPSLAEYRIASGISNQVRHDAFSFFGVALDRAVAQRRDQFFAEASVLYRWGLFVEAVKPNENLHGQGVFIGPMLVNRGFADAGARGDGVHAGGVNSLLGKKANGSFEDFDVGFFAARSGH